jgi:hypothetical protein
MEHDLRNANVERAWPEIMLKQLASSGGADRGRLNSRLRTHKLNVSVELEHALSTTGVAWAADKAEMTIPAATPERSTP